MIDAKLATEKAIEKFNAFYPEAKKVQLEEVELSSDKKLWLVTLGFDSDELASPTQLIIGKMKRYKVFHMDAESGELLHMKGRIL